MKKNLKRGNKKSFTHIGKALDLNLQDLKSKFNSHDKKELREIKSIWDSIFDANIKENADPKDLKNGSLTILISSSPWMQHMQFLKDEIKEELNAAYGSDIIREIRFQIGKIQADYK